ncbi:RibD family protein [Catenuloplanes atrovinosus]|uniref:5-amino-6-(5-phosphoribosylamino)uracil reductase n=1 Tax=Catenuloplanes atrovinosus TaxID=137266 RepID=A0AAE4CBG1_9ACTN|nr:RibD family protein [Catenuloplanes atrovinosus]MDR7278053.1 5-amino-6-(5-phosphoribosylamino)uracil reductase [Catenuloplanes atrovinosus]
MGSQRPYTLLSCAMSVDGYIDDASAERLILSNDADLDRVDLIRSTCDAILVGASTVRRDNPRLVVRSRTRRDDRVARRQPASPVKVTLTRSGSLDPASHFFTVGESDKLVYTASPAFPALSASLAGAATVIDAGADVALDWVLADLSARGVHRLMVEGGAAVHAEFLTAGLVDELQLVVAPFLVGDPAAPRFAGGGELPWEPDRRMTVAEVRQIGDVVLLRYLLTDRFEVPV